MVITKEIGSSKAKGNLLIMNVYLCVNWQWMTLRWVVVIDNGNWKLAVVLHSWKRRMLIGSQ